MEFFTDMNFSFWQMLLISFIIYHVGSLVTAYQIKKQAEKELLQFNEEMSNVLTEIYKVAQESDDKPKKVEPENK